MVLILTVINFITIHFFREEQQIYENEIVSVYQEILKQNKTYPLPPHINRFGEELKIDKAYSEEKFKQYSTTVLIWESLFILILSYFFYKILGLISRKEKEHEEFLKFLFFILSHKIGNFLSVVKTNTAILKLNPNLQSIDRIERSCHIIDDEIKKSMETIKKLPRISKSKQKIDVSELIKKLLTKYDSDKKIIFTSRRLNIEANIEALETIIFLLLDNAFRYAHSKVHIKICRNAFAIRNDFSEIFKGSGIGLQIVDYLCKTYNFSASYRTKGDNFLVFLSLER